MMVRVKLFAAAREFAGSDELKVELPEDSTVAGLRTALLAQWPALEPLLAHAMFAIDANYANDTQTILENSEVAFIPPVSGG